LDAAAVRRGVAPWRVSFDWKEQHHQITVSTAKAYLPRFHSCLLILQFDVIVLQFDLDSGYLGQHSEI